MLPSGPKPNCFVPVVYIDKEGDHAISVIVRGNERVVVSTLSLSGDDPVPFCGTTNCVREVPVTPKLRCWRTLIARFPGGN